MKERDKRIANLIKVVINLANVVDEAGENGKMPYVEELGLGYRALSSYLREGAKAVIDLQHDYHGAIEQMNLAQTGEESARNEMEAIFGDRELETINEKDRERIKDFVSKIIEGWEDEDE